MANNQKRKNTNNINRKPQRRPVKRKSRLTLRPVSAAMIAFTIIIIIVLCAVIPSYDGNSKIMNASETTENTDTGSIPEIKECSDNTIITLFKNYYNSLASGDTEKLKGLYDTAGDVTDEASLSDVVDEFQNLRIYEADGLNENEKAIFVYYEVKFFDVDEAAPGVDSFYITTESGEPKLMSEMYTNSEIVNYLYALSEEEPIKSLMDSTDEWLSTALSKDSVLNEVYNTMVQIVNEQQSELQNNN